MKSDQFTIQGLAARRYWTLFNDWMVPFVKRCENIAKEVNPELWNQWEEGFTTGSEFVNKLVCDLSDVTAPNYMGMAAASELLVRADQFCRNFVAGWRDFIRTTCPVEYVDYMARNPASIGAFQLACLVSNKLNEDTLDDKAA